MYIIRTGIKYHLSTKSEVITGKSQTEVNTLEVIFNFPLQAHRVIQGRVHRTKTWWCDRYHKIQFLWQWDNFCLYYVKIVAKFNHLKKIS